MQYAAPRANKPHGVRNMIAITGISIDHARVRPGRQAHLTGEARPVISWAARSNRPGDKQAAYRISAGEWDSGWIYSAVNSARLPEGALKRGAKTEIRLSVRSLQGDVSPEYTDWICDARTDWDAKWIAAAQIQRNRPMYLRRRFCAPENVRAARLYACGLGYHELRVNGVPVDGARLDPAHVDYSKRVQYVMFPDIAAMLHGGENEICAIVAPGWRDNTGMHQHAGGENQHFSFEGPLEFSAILEIETCDGDLIRILTDKSWQAGAGAVTYANIFNGETYDANVDASFAPAIEVDAPGGRLEPMLIPPVTEHALRTPVAFWSDGPDSVIFDFGQNIAGVVRVLLPWNLQKGQKLTLTHTEELAEDGRLFRDTLRVARQEDTYIASGDRRDLETWQSRFTYHGFRYARLAGVSPEFDPHSVRAVELRTDVDSGSYFVCGSALITKIHNICVATERANIHSILTDCPQRNERLGWMNDATVRFEETPYNFDVGALFPKVVRDMMDSQSDDGAITCTAPYVWGNRPADPVCSSFLVAGYEAAMHTGNLDIVREAYPAYCAWENCLLKHSDGYIVNYSYYGDWAGPADCCVPGNGVDPGAESAVTPGIFMSTGYSYFNCRLLARFAGWLNMPCERKKWLDTAERVKAAMLGRWYDPLTASFATGSQACLAFALWLGIAPEPARTAARLQNAVEQAGWRLTTGNLCSRYIMDALTENGYLETAWHLMTREEYPSIGYMIQQEATTVWERFELMKAPGMNSHNHPMYGAVDRWMYAHLAGIKCTGLGWRRFSVKPYMPEKLMSAQASVDTPLGEISLRWTKRYGGKHLQLNVPFGAEAEIDFCGIKKTVGSGFHTISVEE